MVVRLYFDPRMLPRTMTRDEWRALDRWRRLIRKELAQQLEARREMIARLITDVSIFGRAAVLDDMVNPPLLLGPYMDQPWPT
jgi:hypothetical protein